jgi:hypothetical protein
MLTRSFWTWALPRLVELPPSSWDSAIRNARQVDFDRVERIGILAGVAFVAYLLRISPEQAASISLPMIYFVQFVEAVPLLVLTVGPVFLRRTRRGIALEIEGHRGQAVPRPDLQSGNK